jgi:hypothetical protein
MTLLLYSTTCTSRLQYTCNFIFKELLNINFDITSNIEEFKSHDGVKINYSHKTIDERELHISPVDLLFQQNITPQKIDFFEINGKKAFFKTQLSDFPFDIFAASFYLLSRYEEYLPHQKDTYGRYAHENSLAFKEGFLDIPLINIWVNDFVSAIQNKFLLFTIHHSPFTFIPTYDIDIAYSYKHKGFVRNVGGFLKSPSLERIRVSCDLKKDPFDTYDWLNTLHEKFIFKPVYFFLVAAQNSLYDKNILPDNKAMWQLVNNHAKKYAIGLHPSWQSGDKKSLLKKEKKQLEIMGKKAITSSRQHYIRFNLPEGYRSLLEAGFTDDYSMGYGSINGFRASVASSFNWFDLEKNEETGLRIHPFCYMEANSYHEQKMTADKAFEELMHYFTICKDVNGTLITIWHNHMVGPDKLYRGWGEMYDKFLQTIG